MLEQITEILKNYCNVDQITPQSYLKNDLGLDSLRLINFIVEVENSLNVVINESDIYRFMTVQDIIDYLEG